MPTPSKATNKTPAFIGEGPAFKRQTFTRSEAASILNVSVGTVDNEIRRGRLKRVKRGLGVGITGAAIDAYRG